MKLSKLLVLSALSLLGLSAQATIVDGVRQKPVPQSGATYQVGEEFYLFNMGSKTFFTVGNDYSTRASVADEGQKVVFTATDAALALGEDVVELKNYVPKFSEMRSAFADNASSIWTDNNGHAHRFWKVMGSGSYYHIANFDIETELLLGWNEKAGDTRLYLLSQTAEGAYVDWMLVTPDDYKAYQTEMKTLLPIYNKAQELKALIDGAKAQGVDVSAQEAVYLNESATIEELQAAINGVKAAVNNAKSAGATAEAPADMTASIVNPTFENASYTGWLGTAPNMTGSGSHGPANVAEHYNKTFDTYQKLEFMPQGVYELGVTAFYRGSWSDYQNGTNRNALLYASADNDTLTTPVSNPWEALNTEPMAGATEWGVTAAESSQVDGDVTYYIPNDPSAGRLYFEKGYYKSNVFFSIEGDTARVGIMKKVAVTNDWTVFDNFSLKYYGKDAAAYGKWLDEKKKSAKDYSGITDLFTESYLTAYNNVLTTATASNKAEVLAAIEKIDAAADSLELNIDLWKQLQSLATEGKAVVANDALDPNYMDDLSDWIDYDLAEDLAKHNFSNAELAAQVAQKQAWIDEAKKHPISETDATNLLTNPDFEQGTKGWTGFKTVKQVKWGNGTNNMPTTGGTSTNTCAEAFSSPEFDLYQVVENAPVGVYEISVQGFCRNGRGDAAWKNYQDQTTYSQPGKFPVYVYLNAAQTPFVNVFSEPVAAGYYKSINSAAEVYVNGEVEFPDGMVSSAIAFSDGMYTQKAYGLVAKEGDAMRIGVKGTSAGLDGEDDNWVIFDNFKLTWKGYQASVIKPVLEEQIAKSKETTSKAMDKDLFAELNAAIAAAEASLAEGEGKKMFNCLSDLYEIDAKVTASAAVFAKLVAANENLAKEIEVATLAGRTSALAEATALNEQLTAGIEGHTIAEADVEAKINEINGLISRLRMPNQDKIDAASDENPVDMTSLIQNPTFDESANGWSGTTAAWGGDKGALAELFNQNYNFYQEFAGMPAGTYQVSVQAFYRSGAAVNDYNTLDSLNTTHAFLYGAAIQGTDTLMNAKPLQRLGAIVNFEGYEFKSISDETVTDYAVVVTDTIDKGTDAESYLRTFVPNMMNTANDAFLNGWFSDNVVTVKLAEGETLRIGLLKTTLLANDWTIFDNWKLTYFGKNSTKEATGDNVTAIRTLDGEGETVKVEFFTLDGRRAGAAQKGLIIVKQTLDNGSVIVKKIRK